jgi:hypothetical protein
MKASYDWRIFTATGLCARIDESESIALLGEESIVKIMRSNHETLVAEDAVLLSVYVV